MAAVAALMPYIPPILVEKHHEQEKTAHVPFDNLKGSDRAPHVVTIVLRIRVQGAEETSPEYARVLSFPHSSLLPS